MENKQPFIQLSNVGKVFGAIRALKNVSLSVELGKVCCVLGDNGAGKSTLISIISGLHPPTEGDYLVDGEKRLFSSPRDALDLGISTVYQGLAMVPLMPVWRNFFLGSEISKGKSLARRLDKAKMKQIAADALKEMGIVIKDMEQPVNTLSGGQRQCVAIARAIHFGARVLILDEPTAALGVKQSGVVLKYVASAARDAGVGVIFITHNPHHAYMVGDSFTILSQGEVDLTALRSEVSAADLIYRMAGGAELESLEHELANV